ncbi:MAG: nuclear transport factor 2 family protein [Planctomycetaceae bacterium]
MTNVLPPLAEAYLAATNSHNAAAFRNLFARGAVVDDNGRIFRGLDAINEWSDREIFTAEVTLELLHAFERDGEAVLTTKVDGNFDRTGLPDPVIIDHRLRSDGGRISELTCRLAGDLPTA